MATRRGGHICFTWRPIEEPEEATKGFLDAMNQLVTFIYWFEHIFRVILQVLQVRYMDQSDVWSNFGSFLAWRRPCRGFPTSKNIFAAFLTNMVQLWFDLFIQEIFYCILQCGIEGCMWGVSSSHRWKYVISVGDELCCWYCESFFKENITLKG